MDDKLKEIVTAREEVDAALIIQYFTEKNQKKELENYVKAYKYLLDYGKGWITEPFENINVSINYLLRMKMFVLTEVEVIPSTIGLLHSLKKIEISSKDISTLPDELFNLFQLEELSIIGTSIEKIPDSIKNLSRLKKLTIVGNDKLINLPATCSFLTALKELNISSNAMELVPSFINELPDLKKLMMDENEFNKDVNLSINSGLELLSLKACNITNLYINLTFYKEIFYLVLDGNSISEKSIEVNTDNKVVYLSLQRTGLKVVPKFISKLAQLVELDLSGNDINTIPYWLKDCKKLRLLNLYDTPLESLNTKNDLLKLIPHLEVIGIDSSKKADGL